MSFNQDLIAEDINQHKCQSIVTPPRDQDKQTEAMAQNDPSPEQSSPAWKLQGRMDNSPRESSLLGLGMEQQQKCTLM